jgi:hypothetical protein
VGPPDSRPSQYRKQARGRRPYRPKARVCLLKGCGKVFQPRYPQARYCSEGCRDAAKRWRDWKSRQRYRKTEPGRKKRQEQSCRRRERLSERKQKGESSGQAEREARVGHRPAKNFFLLRSAGLLRDVRPDAPLAAAAILFIRLSKRPLSRARAGAKVAEPLSSRAGDWPLCTHALSVTYCQEAGSSLA